MVKHGITIVLTLASRLCKLGRLEVQVAKVGCLSRANGIALRQLFIPLSPEVTEVDRADCGVPWLESHR